MLLRTVSLITCLVVAGVVLTVGPSPAPGQVPPEGPTAGPQGRPGGGPGGHGGQAVVVPDCEFEGTEHFIDVGGRRLHGYVYGAGAPTVVLVSGLNAPQAYWNAVVNGIAGATTVITYDRAGYGRSEVGELPLDGAQSARDLHALLAGMGVPGPYVLVGHSYGVGVARLFASAYPENTGGLILVDGQHEDILDEQRKILEGEDLERLEEMVAMMESMADETTEIGSSQLTMEQLRSSGPLPEVPFVVITAGKRSMALPPFFSDAAREKLIALGLSLQERLVALIPGGRHIVAEGVGHNVQVEKPDVVTGPLGEMIDRIRSGDESRDAGGESTHAGGT
jgi:pimeloyl-ACP methyl ester carboxylesterase